MSSILGGILQATGAMDPDMPRRNLTREARSYMKALPTVLSAQSFYDPQLQALAQESQDRMLFGTEGGTETRTIYGLRNKSKGANSGFVTTPYEVTVNTPKSEGLFSLAARAGEGIRELDAAVSPEYSNLLKGLISRAQEDVDAGNELTPDQLRQVQQQIRAGQSARGMGFGTGDTIKEAVAATLRGMDVREGRLGSARSTAGLYRSSMPTWQDAIRLVTGGGTSGQTASFVNPFNPYNADLQNTNYGAKAFEEIASKNNRIHGLDSIADGTMSIASMFMGGMGGMGGGGGGSGSGGKVNMGEAFGQIRSAY